MKIKWDYNTWITIEEFIAKPIDKIEIWFKENHVERLSYKDGRIHELENKVEEYKDLMVKSFNKPVIIERNGY